MLGPPQPPILSNSLNGKIKDRFIASATWGDVQKWLTDGNPCIILHDYFTRNSHIMSDERPLLSTTSPGDWNDWGYQNGQDKGSAVLTNSLI